MNVSFRTIANRRFDFNVDPSETIQRIKAVFVDEHGFDGNNLKLVYKGQTLEDSSTLAECGVDGTGFVVIYAPMKLSGPRHAPMPEIEPLPTPAPPSPSPSPSKLSPTLHSSPLPTLVPPQAVPDPPNFGALVSELGLLGFSIGACEDALRAAIYRKDLAVEYLLDGVPEMPHYVVAQPEEPESGDEEERDRTDQVITEQLRLVRAGGQTFIEFLDYLHRYYPVHASVAVRSPAHFLADYGFSAADFDLAGAMQSMQRNNTMYDEMMVMFTIEEKAKIRRIEEKGFDTMLVIQVFIACERDEMSTELCLRSMVE
jgi:hypothetical protein